MALIFYPKRFKSARIVKVKSKVSTVSFLENKHKIIFWCINCDSFRSCAWKRKNIYVLTFLLSWQYSLILLSFTTHCKTKRHISCHMPVLFPRLNVLFVVTYNISKADLTGITEKFQIDMSQTIIDKCEKRSRNICNILYRIDYSISSCIIIWNWRNYKKYTFQMFLIFIYFKINNDQISFSSVSRL